jgi:restriction endonuclease S subunit
MAIKLSLLCEINTGIYEKPTVGGQVYYIQSRDFNTYLEFNENIVPELQESSKFKKHFLQKGDVLIAAKGGNYFSVVYSAEVSPAVASSTFLILREIDEKRLLPEFLAWFLNHPKTQLYLSSHAKGSNIPYISKTLIMELEIDLPALETQKRILGIHQLRIQEKKLVHKIEGLKETMLNERLIQAI